MMKRSLVKIAGAVAFSAGLAMAAETLFSNNTFNVHESGSIGSLWVFSRGDTYSGATLLELSIGSGGNVQVSKSAQVQTSDSVTAVQDGIFTDVLAEHRRTPAVFAGKLGYVLPMFMPNDDNDFLEPAGFLSIRGTSDDDVYEMPFDVPDALGDLDSTMITAVGGFAYDSSAKQIWIARGAAGLRLHDFSGSKAKTADFVLNETASTMDSLKSRYKWSEKTNPSIYDVKRHPVTGDLWLATSKGVWTYGKDGTVKKASETLGSDARVTGLWMGGDPLQIIAETSAKGKESTLHGALYRMFDGDKDFAKVNFLDTAENVRKKDVYDDGDYTVSDVAFIGGTAYVAVSTSGASVSGYFKLEKKGIRAWDVNDDGKFQWLYGYETGATDRDVAITSICAFPLEKNRTGLAIATYGNGVSVSADSGATWSTILNRHKLGSNLGSVRMVPSVITAGNQALISYKVAKDSKITIDVFSYDMRKIRTIVKSAHRDADASRSTNPKEDFWDGYDEYGRPCTMGVYYVRVKDNHGHIGWGKVMTLGGHK